MTKSNLKNKTLSTSTLVDFSIVNVLDQVVPSGAPYSAPTSELVPDLELTAKAYKRIVSSGKKNLETLKEIGIVLNVLYKPYADRADKAWGDYIKTTELVIMSRSDRSNAQWLANNWDNVQAYKINNCCDSNSVGSLRKLLLAAEKAEAKKLAAELDKTTGPVETGESEPEGDAPTKTGKQLTDFELVELMLELCEAHGHSPKVMATMFKNAAKTA